MKKILVFFLIMFGLFSKVSANYIKLAYDFEFSGIEGKTIKLSDYKNKVIVVVNVASRCGFTNQYDGLQKLWTDYKDKDLVVLGVPTNDFKQEPGSNSEIKDFCETNFNVSFPMTKKINVIGKELAFPNYEANAETLEIEESTLLNTYFIFGDTLNSVNLKNNTFLGKLKNLEDKFKNKRQII